MIMMRKNGLFKTDKIKDTAQYLFTEWASSEKDYDQTIMRLKFDGLKDGEKISKIFNLLDYYDQKNNISSICEDFSEDKKPYKKVKKTI